MTIDDHDYIVLLVMARNHERELGKQVDEAMPPAIVAEFAALTKGQVIEKWNNFVGLAQGVQQDIEATGEYYRQDREVVEEAFDDVSRINYPSFGSDGIVMIDIYLNGFKVITSSDAHRRRSVEQKQLRPSYAVETIRKVECELKLLDTYAVPTERTRELGLHVIQIYSPDKVDFSEYQEIFVPAQNLVPR